MRPVRLELEGFSAFRHRTVVDFTDADLFALTGPTGAGKSSLVDAMVFALYGVVPRLGKRAVAPAISLGADEARVLLRFSVDGTGYTAARVVRRTRGGAAKKAGATTKEARLERDDGEVLAGNEKELTEAVVELLGLSYEHFTRCVVLPQGEFAAFLHDRSADKQDLLVKLLGLDLYGRMAELARRREQATREALGRVEGRLAELAGATPEACASAATRVGELEMLLSEMQHGDAALARCDESSSRAADEVEAAEERVALLDGVRRPDGLDERAAQLSSARGRLAECEQAAEHAARAADEAEEGLGELPKRPELERAVEAHERVARLTEQQSKGKLLEVEAAQRLHDAEAALGAARDSADEGLAALEAAQSANAAAHLAEHLVVGEPCPVCGHPVDSVPPASTGADPIHAARSRHREADREVERRQKEANEAAVEHTSLATKMRSIAEQLSDLAPSIEAHADAELVCIQLHAVEAAEKAAREANAAQRAARQEERLARERLAELDAAAGADIHAFDEARDRVAALGPPVADRADVAAAWQALAGWAAAQRPRHVEAAQAAREQLAQLGAEQSSLRRQLGQRAAEAGLALPPGHGALGPSVADALGAARRERDHLESGRARAEELGAEADELGRSRALSHELAKHLSANHFEKWVLDEAMAALAAAATEILGELSSGAYSLVLDPQGNFAVADHRNADEVRPARTLSGGETFLASLALALALSDQIAALATAGTARLDSIFLDEGFGSLDPATLDVVAGAIEELGSRGRMVGLISHVEELAERVPVRFVVANPPGGSTVERVDA